MTSYNTIIYTFFGILPSLIWLAYYLEKDSHPEPKKMIIQVFLWGAVMALPVVFVEWGLRFFLDKAGVDLVSYNLMLFFLIIAPVEEFFKYLVIKVKVINSPHLDEPVDIMIYMVIAALGFACVENIVYMFSYGQPIAETLNLSLMRFIGAVFIHTLSSAIIGYSLAISFCEVKRKRLVFIIGILLAIALHGLFNFVMISLPENASYPIATFIIITSAFIIFTGFEKLKKMKSICKIN